MVKKVEIIGITIQGLTIMTNFLPAGIINDQLKDIYDATCRLEDLVSAEVSDGIFECIQYIKSNVQEVLQLIQGFPCQPLIYTGRGSTEEVIARLEWLLAFGANADNLVANSAPNRKKRKRKAAASGS